MNAPFEPHVNSLSLLQAQCGALGAASPDAGAEADLTRRFQANCALIRADLLTDLFPALLESMAGSDAVCIRAMQAGAAARLDALETAWRAWDSAAPGPTRAVLPACRELLAFEQAELLPMAERLLDEHALAQVLQAMQGRRAAA